MLTFESLEVEYNGINFNPTCWGLNCNLISKILSVTFITSIAGLKKGTTP